MRLLIWITTIMVISQDVSAAAAGGINAAAEASNAFAADLYQHVGVASEQNTFFSPSSIATALAMTSLGARGETERQMWSVLKFDNAMTHENAHQAFSELLKLANGGGDGDRGYQLNIANRLWGQAGYHFLPAFVDATRKYYGAPLEELNFGDAETSRLAINRWVEKQTADKIKDLLKPGVLSRDTRLVLTNAVYFKGAWANPFKKDLTRDEPFHLPAAKDMNVPTMHRQGGYRYAEDESAQILELPYAKDEVSMVIVLPRKIDGLPQLEKGMDSKWLGDAVGRLKKREVQMAMPRFTMRAEFELSTVLSAMGMPLAFDGNKADFSGMTTQEKVAIDKVIHQAFVDVNEEGTEAAGATAVTITRMVARLPDAPVVFRADHPFIFMIRDTRSGALLFMGKVVNPPENGETR